MCCFSILSFYILTLVEQSFEENLFFPVRTEDYRSDEGLTLEKLALEFR